MDQGINCNGRSTRYLLIRYNDSIYFDILPPMPFIWTGTKSISDRMWKIGNFSGVAVFFVCNNKRRFGVRSKQRRTWTVQIAQITRQIFGQKPDPQSKKRHHFSYTYLNVLWTGTIRWKKMIKCRWRDSVIGIWQQKKNSKRLTNVYNLNELHALYPVNICIFGSILIALHKVHQKKLANKRRKRDRKGLERNSAFMCVRVCVRFQYTCVLLEKWKQIHTIASIWSNQALRRIYCCVFGVRTRTYI